MCSGTPRFSYSVPETRVRAVSTRMSDVCGQWCAGRGMVPGWVYGWVLGRAIPVPTQHVESGGSRQRSGPRKACRAWSGWSGPAAPARLQNPPSGPGRLWLPGSGPSPLNAASWPIRARFQLNNCKVSQNHGVSPKYVHEACHSPYFQNGSQMSTLQFLRFPFWLAFSHKELIGLFWPDSRFYVKMTKCRVNVHPRVREGVAQIPPRVHAASCSCVPAPHLSSAR